MLEALRPILGAAAEVLCEAQGRSLHKLDCFARDSSLPGCVQLLCGLRLARQMLAEELRPGEAFRSMDAGSDIKLHFAGQAHESFSVLFLSPKRANPLKLKMRCTSLRWRTVRDPTASLLGSIPPRRRKTRSIPCRVRESASN